LNFLLGNITLSLPPSSFNFSVEVAVAFDDAFAAELASLLGLPASQVETIGIAPSPTGGTQVSFEVLPASSGGVQSVSPLVVAGTLKAKLGSPISVGTFLPTVKPSSLAYAVYSANGTQLTAVAPVPPGSGAAGLTGGWIAAVVFAAVACIAIVTLGAVLWKHRETIFPPRNQVQSLFTVNMLATVAPRSSAARVEVEVPNRGPAAGGLPV